MVPHTQELSTHTGTLVVRFRAMTITATRTGKRLNPQRRKAIAISKQAETALALLPEFYIYPNQIQPGDIIATGEDRNGNPTWNSDAKAVKADELVIDPRGCRNKTHVGQNCYDNICPVWVKFRYCHDHN